MLGFINKFRGLYSEVWRTKDAAYVVVYKTEKIDFTTQKKCEKLTFSKLHVINLKWHTNNRTTYTRVQIYIYTYVNKRVY
jgi:hypothetical protein